LWRVVLYLLGKRRGLGEGGQCGRLCPSCGGSKGYYANSCRRCQNRTRIGDGNPNWKGGRVFVVGRRVAVYAPGHPEAKLLGGTHALRYRMVASDMLGRPLRPGEVVHHKNGDETDDRPENLEVMTDSAHMRAHLVARRNPITGQNLPKGAPMPATPDRRKPCAHCGNIFEPNPHHRRRQRFCSKSCVYAGRRQTRPQGITA